MKNIQTTTKTALLVQGLGLAHGQKLELFIGVL